LRLGAGGEALYAVGKERKWREEESSAPGDPREGGVRDIIAQMFWFGKEEFLNFGRKIGQK
jgi:hypothetical protein